LKDHRFRGCMELRSVLCGDRWLFQCPRARAAGIGQNVDRTPRCVQLFPADPWCALIRKNDRDPCYRGRTDGHQWPVDPSAFTHYEGTLAKRSGQV